MDEFLKLLTEAHDEELTKEPTVWELWYDGEVTMTKGGEIYNLRNRHTAEFGQPGLRWQYPKDRIVTTRENALALRVKFLSLATSTAVDV